MAQKFSLGLRPHLEKQVKPPRASVQEEMSFTVHRDASSSTVIIAEEPDLELCSVHAANVNSPATIDTKKLFTACLQSSNRNHSCSDGGEARAVPSGEHVIIDVFKKMRCLRLLQVHTPLQPMYDLR
jgi:hypothetical protein